LDAEASALADAEEADLRHFTRIEKNKKALPEEVANQGVVQVCRSEYFNVMA
jgi:hypothetical protein